MEDRMVEMLSEEYERVILDSARKRSSVEKSSGVERAFEIGDLIEEEVDLGGNKESCFGKTEGNGDSICISSEENEKDESSPDQGHTLPILRKILHLSTNIQDLKRGYSLLADAVNDFRTSSHAVPECFQKLDNMANEYDTLKKKYLEESNKRKRLYNEVIELKGNIRVFCRCRPLNSEELDKGSVSALEFDASQDNELQVTCSDSSKKHFRFDHVFKPEDNQEIVFAQTKPIITSVLDGYNVCIFAYGQTGTGKTFTMEGTQKDRGVNYRTLEELFRMAEERNGVMKYDLFVSMLEVYNEKIRDLLLENNDQETKKLDVKQAAEGTQEVLGLVESHVFSTQEVWEILKRGSRARSVGSTSANELSSRSHCLLRVTVKGENLINGQRNRSHLWMVDLAGSERVGRTEVEGERLKESQFINKSLSALGDVIAALASKSAHIPYRNSKLTHMLQSSLGGDCKTLMFVQISPHPLDVGETLCSLNFASRVRGIESGPAHKQADISELLKYKQMVEKLKHDDKETRKLQENVQSLQLRLAAREHTCRSLQEKVEKLKHDDKETSKLQENVQSLQLRLAAREHTCRSLQEKVRDLENQLGEERKTRLKQETGALNVAAATQPLKRSSKPPPPKTMADRKPPLGPSGTRLPLRRITNFIPLPSPSQKPSMPTYFKGAASNKENLSKINGAPSKPRMSMQPRRISMVIGNTAPSTGRLILPRRRVSIATFRPEPGLQMMTPLASSSARTGIGGGSIGGRQSFVQQDPRKARYSRLFSPAPRASSDMMRTPIAMNSGCKFGGSPTAVQGSWKPKHPTVVALHRRSLLWSPLKLKTMRISSMKPQLSSGAK